jgi:hypothetical protein
LPVHNAVIINFSGRVSGDSKTHLKNNIKGWKILYEYFLLHTHNFIQKSTIYNAYNVNDLDSNTHKRTVALEQQIASLSVFPEHVSDYRGL